MKREWVLKHSGVILQLIRKVDEDISAQLFACLWKTVHNKFDVCSLLSSAVRRSGLHDTTKSVASAFIEPSGLKYKRRYKRWTSIMNLLSRKFSTFTLLIVRNFKIISTPIVCAPSCYASFNMCPTIYASAHYDESAVSFTGLSSVYWIQRKKI